MSQRRRVPIREGGRGNTDGNVGIAPDDEGVNPADDGGADGATQPEAAADSASDCDVSAGPPAPADPEPRDDTASDAGPAAAPGVTVESLQNQIADLNDRLLRARAEASNIQRRAAAERADAVRFAKMDVVSPLLAVIDDFERSLAVTAEGEEATNLLTGVRLVYDKLLKALRDQGIAPIEATGKPFDPNFHEAMMRQPTADLPPGRVMQELTRGYVLGDRVIRPARVIVSVEPAAPSPPASGGDAPAE